MAYADATQDERVSAGSTTFKSTLLGLQGETTGTASTYYTRDEDGRLVSQRTPNGTHYYLFDGLGSVVALTDSSGGVVASYSYEPYGRTTASGTVSNPWRFAAGYFDGPTGLYKFGTRYYDPTLARWTQPDPVSGEISNPLTLNRYEYANACPVNFTDPTGRFSFSCFTAAARIIFYGDARCGRYRVGCMGSMTVY